MFAIKTRHKPISRDNCKITQKEMSKLFSYDYLNTNYSVVKHRRNISFQEIGTESLTEKNNGF